ncbi:glycosyltransferase, partial [Actinotignum timonense]
NIGLSLARGEFVTFVDADDSVQPRFLEQLVEEVGPGIIPVAPILNYQGSELVEENALAERILQNAGKSVPVDSVPWMLGFNACK